MQIKLLYAWQNLSAPCTEFPSASRVQLAWRACGAGGRNPRLRTGLVARQDAPLVARLKDAGAIILGGNQLTPELLMAWETWTTCCMAAPTARGIWTAHRAAPAAAEAAAVAFGMSAGGVVEMTVAARSALPRISAVSVDMKPTSRTHPCHRTFSRICWSVCGDRSSRPHDSHSCRLKIVFPGCHAVPRHRRYQCSARAHPLLRAKADARKLRMGCFEDDGRTPVTAETRARQYAPPQKPCAAPVLKWNGFGCKVSNNPASIWRKCFVVAGGMLLQPCSTVTSPISVLS